MPFPVIPFHAVPFRDVLLVVFGRELLEIVPKDPGFGLDEVIPQILDPDQPCLAIDVFFPELGSRRFYLFFLVCFSVHIFAAGLRLFLLFQPDLTGQIDLRLNGIGDVRGLLQELEKTLLVVGGVVDQVLAKEIGRAHV